MSTVSGQLWKKQWKQVFCFVLFIFCLLTFYFYGFFFRFFFFCFIFCSSFFSKFFCATFYEKWIFQRIITIIIGHCYNGNPTGSRIVYCFIYTYFYVTSRFIGLVGRVFANGPEDLGSILARVIPKTLKMVLDTYLLNTQQYKLRIKGKVEQSWERSSALPYISV